MLLACVNVALLLLALNAARHKEFAVRLALGATRRRLMWQSWLDSVLLSVAGGSLGAAIAFPSLRLIRDLGPVGIPRLREAVADGRVFVVAIAAVTLAAILTGILPVLEVKDASITPAIGGTSAQTKGRMKIFGRIPVDSILTTVQVALVLLLVAVASLLLRSVTRLLTVDPGFASAGLTAIQFEPVRTSEPDFSRQVIEGLGRIPGVDSVAAGRYLKFMPMLSGVTVDGSPNAVFEVSNQIASSEFFATLGIRILEGRTFSPDLHPTDPCPVVVNRAFAEAAWPGQRPLGRIVNAGFPCTVIGVVGDVRFHADGSAPRYQIYFSDRSRLGGSDTFFVRLRRDDRNIRASVVAYAKSIDPTRRIAWSGRMSDVLYERVVTPPFYAVVFGWFGAVGLVLAAVGVYGMMSEVVVRRRREMGIRLAVGATRANIRSMLLIRAASMLAVGVVMGLVAAVAIGKWAGHMLYDMTPSDPIALFTACVVVVAVGLLAAMIPSHRASRLDPTELFRME
jgi:predicted permease